MLKRNIDTLLLFSANSFWKSLDRIFVGAMTMAWLQFAKTNNEVWGDGNNILTHRPLSKRNVNTKFQGYRNGKLVSWFLCLIAYKSLNVIFWFSGVPLAFVSDGWYCINHLSQDVLLPSNTDLESLSPSLGARGVSKMVNDDGITHESRFMRDPYIKMTLCQN